MSDALQAAIVVSIGPTLVGVAALVQATFAKREAAGANAAVNHKDVDAPSISDQVDRIDKRTVALTADLQAVSSDVADVRRVQAVIRTASSATERHLERHLAHHQAEEERREERDR